MEESARYETFDDFLQFMHSLNNINLQEINDTVIYWLQQLPLFIDAIIGNDDFNELWETYQRIIDMRSENYTKTLQLAEKSINEFNAGSELKFPDIVFSPNLLQSPYIADFVIKGDQIVIIKTAPDILSIVHEFMHFIIRLQRDCFKKYIRKYDFTKIADAGKLLSSGCMWNESDESRITILEESFVRGLSIAMTVKISDSKQTNDYVRWDLASGFKLVPIIVQQAKNKMPNRENIKDFVIGVLDSVF